jgi:hypothetical protein
MGRRVRQGRGSSAKASSPEGLVLSEELTELVESGVSILVGSCDADGRPEALRGLGARVSADRQRITVLLNGALAKRTRDNLADGGRLAVAFSRIYDHRTIQLKGRAVTLRDGSPEDEAIQQRYLVAFSEQVSVAGMPRSVVRHPRRGPARRPRYRPSTSTARSTRACVWA